MKHIATLFLSAAAFAAFAAEVQRAALNDLDLDANPQVVTNVTFAGLAASSNTYTKTEADARIVALAPAPGNYETVSNRAMNISLPGDEGHPGGVHTPIFKGRANLAAGALALTKSGQIAYPGSLELKQRWYEDAYGAISGVMWPSFLDAGNAWRWVASEDYVDAATNAIPRDYLPLTGGTMQGDIDMSGGIVDGEPTDSAWFKFGDYYFGYGYMGAGFGIYQSTGGMLSGKYLFNGDGWYSEYGVSEDVMTRADLADALSDIPQPDMSNYATHLQATNAARAVSAPLESNVGVLWQYVLGESVWFAVTNYMRTVEGVTPSLQLWEVRNGVTNLVYFSREEITNVVNDATAALRADLTNSLAARAWSAYQSATGAANPQPADITIVSTPSIMLTGGGEWNRYVNTGGSAVWVLKSNGLTTFGGGANGTFFAVQDDEGNSQFEVSRTDSYEVDAVADSISWDGSGNFQVTYNAPSSGNQPVLYASTNLTTNFAAEENGSINALGIDVTWANSGGLWRATIEQDVTAPVLFVHAKVLQEGSVVIKNKTATSLEGGIMLNGTKYSLGTATINGNTVLTLTPQ